MSNLIDHLNSFIIDRNGYSVTYNDEPLPYLPYPDSDGMVEIAPRCGRIKAVKVKYTDLIALVKVRPCGDMMDWEHEESNSERLQRWIEGHKDELKEIQ